MADTIKIIKHTDRLGQPIRVGDRVAFTYSTCPTVLVGQVLKCTPKRVKIQYKGLYLSSKGVREYYVGYRVGVPDDCLILNEGLQSTLTMEALKNRL